VKNRQDNGMALITAILVLLLTSTMIVGVAWLTLNDQRLGGNNNDRQLAFYGAESGLETLTARLENEFDANYAPTATDISNLQLNPPTNVPGVQYLAPGLTTNGTGFTITFNKDGNGNPASNSGQLTTGQESGLVSQNTPYTLTVTAHTSYGSEVRLQRVVQTVAIPVFEFGVFCQYDCAFFSGTNFTMGGRVAANGNLWLQEQSGKTLKISGKTTAAGEIDTTTLENGGSVAAYGGTVDLADNNSVYHDLLGQPTTQSVNGTTWNMNTLTAAEAASPVTYTYNSGFNGVAKGTYGNNVGVNETGVKPLNVAIATAAIGGQPIDLIRRPVLNEDTASPNKLAERFYGNQQTSVRILLSDYGTDGTCAKSDISSTSPIALPNLATNATNSPVDLATLSWDTSATTHHLNDGGHPPPYNAAPGGITTANIGPPVYPLPVSYAQGASYNAGTNPDGYWVQEWYPIITGCLKIEYQDNQSPQVWHDITWTVLNLGYTGRNINPQPSTGYVASPRQPSFMTTDVASQGPTVLAAITPVCNTTIPSPNAVIRLARVRDNPSFAATGGCGTLPTGATTQHGTDYWPNVLYDPREGLLRDYTSTTVTSPTLAGSMYYVELDVANLARCLTGVTCTGISNIENTTGYAVYFSDRRSEQKDSNPPASVGTTAMLTGGFGYDDFVNPTDGNGCPNGTLNTGEDVESDYTNGISQNPVTTTTPRTYGNILNPGTAPPGLWPVSDLGNTFTYPAQAYSQLYATVGTAPIGTALTSLEGAVLTKYPPDTSCVGGTGLTWPYVAAKPMDVRENPPIFFRRALKLVDGSSIGTSATASIFGSCNSVPCGLTIASENPVYVQGDYNNNPNADATLNTPSTDKHAACAIIADAVTLLSDYWNDANSFAFPYVYNNSDPTTPPSKRRATQTTYRVAILGGKQVPFPKPTYTTPTPDADMGTDGGVHNFLRFIEDWNGVQIYYTGSLVSMYYNHQAVGIYKYNQAGGSVYDAPSRNYSFDQDFLTPALLPPETPMLRDVNAIGFTQMILPTQ